MIPKQSGWLVIVFCWAVAVQGQGADPFLTPDADSAAAEIAASGIKLRRPDLRVPLDWSTAVTFGTPGCPVFVVSNQIMSSVDYRLIGEIEGAYDPQGHRALSADGKWFAASSKSPNQTETTVFVWSTETGKTVLEIDGKPDEYADLVALSRDRYLLIGGRQSNQIQVWDLESGVQLPKKLSVPANRLEPNGGTVFSPDGKMFATIDGGELALINTATNRNAAKMAEPGSPISGFDKRRASIIKELIGDQPDANFPSFVFAWVRGIQFSPDGRELAVFSTHPYPRLMIWSSAGKLLADEPVPRPADSVLRPVLEWAPDGKSLLLNEFLIDRDTCRTLASIRLPKGCYLLPRFLDQNRLVGSFHGDAEKLQVVQIPWEQIRESMKLSAEESGAWLSPSNPVSLVVEASSADVKTLVTNKVTKRLLRDGLRVEPGQLVTLRVTISEQQGETLPIYERQSLADRQGQDTGRTASEVKGAAVLEWLVEGHPNPLWRGHLSARSGRTFNEEINDLSIRQSMLDEVTWQLGSMDIPWLIPESTDRVALPVVIE